ncbi:lysophospholipid acyltransferase family protein [Nakamurella leprariae]|uniref:1-acyl-sn-glycerol-3-phosphate acyltransferase n=1 Tax=Nakamurella leprariae TaxID=2803911 RepID=A0A939BVJ4_9ACTN|nr:lysophospholipid acyltransferase family protein [Nakamurella leprariae]MBM9466583.1 1-acyl-sn-glycerol-3-phosphate acyltransferase [Nakamurella leprariae]
MTAVPVLPAADVPDRCVRPECVAGCATPTARGDGRRGVLAAAARFAGVIAVLLVTVGVLQVVHWTPRYGRTSRSTRSLRRCSRWLVRVLGVRVEVRGEPHTGGGLVVGNHVSWLDLIVLSAQAPQRAVAKDGVGTWPVIGGLARRTGTLFLRRGLHRDLPESVAQMTAALRRGHRVQIFPEGTTRCGQAVGEFRRAGFQAAIDAAVLVHPVTLAYRDGTGTPTTAPAFVGDMTVVESIRAVVRMSALTVQVHWLDPIPALAGSGRAATDRRRLAAQAERAVAHDLGQPVVRRDSAWRGDAVA